MARLGRPIHAAGKPVRKGSRLDLSASIAARQNAQKTLATQVVEEMCKKYIGKFDTGLVCNCGNANITDHATEHDPNARPRDPFMMQIGPGPYQRPEEKIRSFRVFHEYWCVVCGATYKASVVQETRSYVPREQRLDASMWLEEKLTELHAL
jgi:hypothetical protein